MTAPFGDPARTALLAAAPPEVARRAGVFRVVVGVAPDSQGRVGLGWSAETRAPDEVALTGDAAGAFLAARIDLLLRSNGILSVVLAPDLPAALRDNVATRCRLLGYAVAQPSDHDAILKAWAEASPGLRGWQAEAKAAALLPDLAARIAPPHAALLLVDVQNDFCLREGLVGRNDEPIALLDRTVPKLRALLASAREAGVMVVHVRAEYGQVFRHVGSPYRFPAAGRRDVAVWSASAGEAGPGGGFGPDEVEVCLKGSWGGALVAGMEPRADEPVVVKHRYSAFRDTGLDVLLRANGIRTLIVAGVTTNCCVESTVREAAMHDFYVVVAEDCVAVKDRITDLHTASLTAQGLYFALVRPLAELRAAWHLPEAASA